MSIILIGLGVILGLAVIAILLLAALKPDRFRVERSIDINTPANRLFASLLDLRHQRQWSTWEQKDPDMRRTYSGAQSGIGAVYDWEGDRNVGAGRQTILATKPDSEINLSIEFGKPCAASNKLDFIFVPKGDATKVTWAIHGPWPFMYRVMATFFSMDRMIGREFENSLANLKVLMEKS